MSMLFEAFFDSPKQPSDVVADYWTMKDFSIQVEDSEGVIKTVDFVSEVDYRKKTITLRLKQYARFDPV